MSQFTKEEIELLAHGFGFFVQEFNHPDGDPCHALLTKLHALLDEESLDEGKD